MTFGPRLPTLRAMTARLAGVVAALALGASAAEFHITPAGMPDGDGSAARPWDLATALAHPAAVQPGDTLWLHGGVYRGSFESRLTGAPGRPIELRQVPGERATLVIEPHPRIGAGLFLRGSHLRCRDFEVRCDLPARQTATAGSWPQDLQRGSVECRGSHLELIHLVIHDLGTGVGFWSEGEGGRIEGCLIYNNGWIGPDRAHGHGIYGQNEKGRKHIVDCLIFGQYGAGIHLYGSEKASLRVFRLSGVAAFDNGRPNRSRDILIGGGSPVDDVEIACCATRGSGLQLGYGDIPDNGRVVARDLYLHGGLRLAYPGDFQISDATLIAPDSLLSLQWGQVRPTAGPRLEGCRFFKTPSPYPPVVVSEPTGTRSGGPELLRQAGLDPAESFQSGPPAENRILLHPSRHQPGRAHLIIYNWEGLDAVPVDPGSLLTVGQGFRIVDARDFFGPPVVAGVYRGGAVPVPMTARTIPAPIGSDPATETTDPAFGAFVVLPGDAP